MNIKIDASRVAGLITGSANLDKVVYDTWAKIQEAKK